MKILFIGDICGSPGREAVKKFLPKVIQEHQPDLVIANGENATHGDGISPTHANELIRLGVNIFTGGNHSFFSKDHIKLLNGTDPVAIRPANYPDGVAGRGFKIIETGAGRVAVINLQGQVFMREHVDCPLRKLDHIIEVELLNETYDYIFIDFHAEATSEKNTILYYAEKYEKIVAIVGTHTHVQTNDAKIGPTGIGYLTDAGMCGALRSIIGVRVEPIIQRMLYQTPQRKEFVADGGLQFNAVLFTIDGEQCQKVEPIYLTEINQ